METGHFVVCRRLYLCKQNIDLCDSVIATIQIPNLRLIFNPIASLSELLSLSCFPFFLPLFLNRSRLGTQRQSEAVNVAGFDWTLLRNWEQSRLQLLFMRSCAGSCLARFEEKKKRKKERASPNRGACGQCQHLGGKNTRSRL